MLPNIISPPLWTARRRLSARHGIDKIDIDMAGATKGEATYDVGSRNGKLLGLGVVEELQEVIAVDDTRLDVEL